MDLNEQRIRIAEACGWRKGKTGGMIKPGTRHELAMCFVPGYLNDLNAMHESEKTLTGGQLGEYWMNLRVAVTRSLANAACLCVPEVAIHATAAQRAEAFLRTIGKWEDSK